jgi:hypothetical protein
VLSDEWRVKVKTGDFVAAVLHVHGGGRASRRGLGRALKLIDGKVYATERDVDAAGPVWLSDIGAIWALE